MKTFLLAISTFIAFSFAVQAQSRTPKVTKRQVKQQKRIVHGAKSGALTYGEAWQLQAQQRNVLRTKRHIKADGTITRKERSVVHHKQNRANRNIRRKKNNAISRN